MIIQKKLLSIAIAAASIGGVCFAAYQYGHLKGYTAANAEHQDKTIESLNGVIGEFKALAKDAKKQSLQLSNTISARQVADQKSTQVFVNALSATSHLRFNCHFDDNIMQQLSQAADRADQAAASGFGNTLRSGSSPN